MNKSPTHAELPPELLVDPSNPANDRYYRALRDVRAATNAIASRMKRRHVEMARMHHAGMRNKEIAERLNLHETTVSSRLKSPKVQELLEALAYAQQLVDGPNLELRRNMLWRIASTNEESEPNTSITALKELNKMSGAYPVQAPQVATVTNITINGELMPRTALDQPPEDST